MQSNTTKFSDDELKKRLTPEEYKVLREGGTEAPFSGEYLDMDEKGVYRCKVCGNPLFKSDTKFDSKTPGLIGWPSFENAIPGSIKLREDNSDWRMKRTEVVCAKCGSHLGHLFEGDPDTKSGKHYCINSVCLDFKED